jgi:hypothetical protein
MSRRARALVAFGTASVLCFGSFEAASALASKSSVPATQAIKACATHGGSLRLTKASGKCPRHTTKIGLARPATAPQAMAIDVTSGGQRKSLSLLDNTELTAGCALDSGNSDAVFSIERAERKTQIDGTSFLVENGGTAFFDHTGGGSSATPVGASSVYSTTAGGFSVHADSGTFATLNAHLLVTVPGAVFTIDVIIDANSDSPYCRITAEVESATT